MIFKSEITIFARKDYWNNEIVCMCEVPPSVPGREEPLKPGVVITIIITVINIASLAAVSGELCETVSGGILKKGMFSEVLLFRLVVWCVFP